MNYNTDEGITVHQKRRRLRLSLTYLAITLILLVCAASFEIWSDRARLQLQTDPRMVSAWIIGTTYGPKQQLTRGTMFQKWLSQMGFHSLGNQEILTSRFHGDSDGMQIWLDYNSFLPDAKYLECHRIGQTAFVDDLGQRYHGFLDFHGRIVGVYLPGYDHAAHRITCRLHWCPRQQYPPRLFSSPMSFTIDLPKTTRQLPAAESLVSASSKQTIRGITVQVSSVRLVPQNLSPQFVVQNQLSFHLNIEGGNLANSNVALGNGEIRQRRLRELLTQIDPAGGQNLLTPDSEQTAGQIPPPTLGEYTKNRFIITDPYGLSLMPDTAVLTPAIDWFGRGYLRDEAGWVWRAPVNGVGIGTDAVRLQLDVRPVTPPNSTPAPPVHFDLIAPVQTSGEV